MAASENKPAGKRNMSAAHKAAMAQGRDEGLAVRRYLEALEAARPKRGRKRTRESVERRLQAVEAELATVDPLARLHLRQEKKDLNEELHRSDGTADPSAYEAAFVAVAASYGERKGISYGTWREAGVPASVLQEASIVRTRS